MRYATVFEIRECDVSSGAATRRLDRRIAAWVLAGALAAGAFEAAALEKFQSTGIKVGNHPLKVELAVTDPQRMQGLMYRDKLGPNDGMLFVFDAPEYQSMWMKNTLIPLSVAFLAPDGTILNVEDMEPQTLDPHMSAGPALYAIETNKGWFAQHGLKPGDKATGLPKAAH
jgi:uncharacterized membrane protein (UPF0127 family)